jgi:hypothetical protein
VRQKWVEKAVDAYMSFGAQRTLIATLLSTSDIGAILQLRQEKKKKKKKKKRGVHNGV